jgi:hypothetical protein
VCQLPSGPLHGKKRNEFRDTDTRPCGAKVGEVLALSEATLLIQHPARALELATPHTTCSASRKCLCDLRLLACRRCVRARINELRCSPSSFMLNIVIFPAAPGVSPGSGAMPNHAFVHEKSEATSTNVRMAVVWVWVFVGVGVWRDSRCRI